MKHSTWIISLAAATALALPANMYLRANQATEAPASTILVNYPGDSPGTQSIDTIAKSTACQEHGHLRYSPKAHHCVDT